MSKLKAVTLGTDGNIDYVETPDGVRYALGTTSILQVVAKLVQGQRHRRTALDLFNQEGQAVVLLDVDAMFEMLAPRRSRWSSATSLIRPSNREAALPVKRISPSQGVSQGEPMNLKVAFDQKLSFIEQQVQILSQGANPAAARRLRVAAAGILLHDMEPVETPSVAAPEPAVAYVAPATLGKTASFSTLQGNMKLAEEIVGLVGETDDAIDRLVTAGRQFNASMARADLHNVVASLTDMMRQVDLAEPWVTGDLTDLAKRASDIHSLFASVKS